MNARELADKFNAMLDDGVEGIGTLLNICVPANDKAIHHMDGFAADNQIFITVLSLLNAAVTGKDILHATTKSGKLRFGVTEVLGNDSKTEAERLSE